MKKGPFLRQIFCLLLLPLLGVLVLGSCAQDSDATVTLGESGEKKTEKNQTETKGESLPEKASATLVFTGDEAEKAGFAQSEISVTPGKDTRETGYFLVYYTDGVKVLEEYDELLSVEIKGDQTVTGKVSDGRMIPVGAKGLAVFESATRFFQSTPAIRDAIATVAIPEKKQLSDLGVPLFSFGLLSDTHMNYEQHNRGAYAKLSAAMDFFAQEKMDRVVITGDVTGDRGESPDLEQQYEKHLEILLASKFPVERVYEAMGNHGNNPADALLLAKYLSGEDEVHPTPDSPYFHVLIPGKSSAERDHLFIFMAQELQKPGDSAKYDNFSKEQMDWLDGLLKQYGKTDTNIFLSLHSPFLGYGAGDIDNGTYTACITIKAEYPQTYRLYNLLKTYRDVVVMSGHTHVSFYENANFSDENGAFARTVHVGSGSQPCAYGTGTKLTKSYDGRKYVTPQYGSEGYTVRIYSDRIVFTGYNFSTGKIIPAACLLLPVTTAK